MGMMSRLNSAKVVNSTPTTDSTNQSNEASNVLKNGIDKFKISCFIQDHDIYSVNPSRFTNLEAAKRLLSEFSNTGLAEVKSYEELKDECAKVLFLYSSLYVDPTTSASVILLDLQSYKGADGHYDLNAIISLSQLPVAEKYLDLCDFIADYFGFGLPEEDVKHEECFSALCVLIPALNDYLQQFTYDPSYLNSYFHCIENHCLALSVGEEVLSSAGVLLSYLPYDGEDNMANVTEFLNLKFKLVDFLYSTTGGLHDLKGYLYKLKENPSIEEYFNKFSEIDQCVLASEYYLLGRNNITYRRFKTLFIDTGFYKEAEERLAHITEPFDASVLLEGVDNYYHLPYPTLVVRWFISFLSLELSDKDLECIKYMGANSLYYIGEPYLCMPALVGSGLDDIFYLVLLNYGFRLREWSPVAETEPVAKRFEELNTTPLKPLDNPMNISEEDLKARLAKFKDLYLGDTFVHNLKHYVFSEQNNLLQLLESHEELIEVLRALGSTEISFIDNSIEAPTWE